jgi:CheY-like chemotaxis protein
MDTSADVLVVDDGLIDAQTTLIAFEQVAPRARVLHLFNGGEALEYLFSTGMYADRAQAMPQLVLLSIHMRHISGLCVLDLMRAHPLTRQVPVVLVGLDANPRHYRRHNEFDANAYVMMPSDFQLYCAIIEGCAAHWLPWSLRPGKVHTPAMGRGIGSRRQRGFTGGFAAEHRALGAGVTY